MVFALVNISTYLQFDTFKTIESQLYHENT